MREAMQGAWVDVMFCEPRETGAGLSRHVTPQRTADTERPIEPARSSPRTRRGSPATVDHRGRSRSAIVLGVGERDTMKGAVWSWFVVGVVVCAAIPAGAQPRAGALAIDERQGDQYGWAVDYETPPAARAAALSECGSGCSVVLAFERCGAYAADQDADSTAVGWAESYASAHEARQAALAECRSRGGGSGCIVRVWGCNGQVVEEALGLNGSMRRQVQRGLQAEGFDPGGADGLFMIDCQNNPSSSAEAAGDAVVC